MSTAHEGLSDMTCLFRAVVCVMGAALIDKVGRSVTIPALTLYVLLSRVIVLMGLEASVLVVSCIYSVGPTPRSGDCNG